ncbi:HAD family hydrolase [Streptomyces sp. NPDC013157]|uniref:HAD family hydrolase n=1 Tax=Streptomyces sp. NPDC013157 TaxID=3364861 RepID=UPI0036C094CB
MSVIFFDIGETLADPHVDPDGSLRLRPLPRVGAVLDALDEVRKGIISNPGPGDGAAARVADALAEAFPGRFTDQALVHWGAKDSRGIFDRAVASAGGAPADACVFVGEDARERAFAREAGMRTAPHPVFTPAAMEDRPVFRARIGLPDGQEPPALTAAMDGTEAVPVQAVSQRLVVAMVTALGGEALERAGFTVAVQGPVEELAGAEKFADDLLARGEAVFEGEEPTSRTTHVIKREDDGRLTVRRLRFFR